MPNPMQVLSSAVKAVPSVKYALGVAGVVAAVSVVAGFKIDWRVAVFGTVVMFIFMAVLVIFAASSALGTTIINLPATVFVWFCLLIFVAVATSLFTWMVADWPPGLATILDPVLRPNAKPGTGLIFQSPPASSDSGQQPATTAPVSLGPKPIVRENGASNQSIRYKPSEAAYPFGNTLNTIVTKTIVGGQAHLRVEFTAPDAVSLGPQGGHYFPVFPQVIQAYDNITILGVQIVQNPGNVPPAYSQIPASTFPNFQGNWKVRKRAHIEFDVPKQFDDPTKGWDVMFCIGKSTWGCITSPNLLTGSPI